MNTLRMLLLIAFAGHLLCWRCDWMLTYTPNGRFQFGDLKDNEKLSRVFEGMSLRRIERAMLFGMPALAMSLCGLLGLCEWMRQYSAPRAAVMATAAVAFAVFGVAHHILCGVVEWCYIRLGRTEEARESVLELFKRTSATMVVCYLGLLFFAVTLFVAVVMGVTPLPRWACIFNVLPVFLVLAPFRIVGTGNLANAVMFLGLALFI